MILYWILYIKMIYFTTYHLIIRILRFNPYEQYVYYQIHPTRAKSYDAVVTLEIAHRCNFLSFFFWTKQYLENVFSSYFVARYFIFLVSFILPRIKVVRSVTVIYMRFRNFLSLISFFFFTIYCIYRQVMKIEGSFVGRNDFLFLSFWKFENSKLFELNAILILHTYKLLWYYCYYYLLFCMRKILPL